MHSCLHEKIHSILAGFPGPVRFVLVFCCILVLFTHTAYCGQDQIVDDYYREINLLAESGDAEAQYSLAMMFDFGDNVPRDGEKAVYWLRKAAEQDLAAACYSLGVKYEFGSTVRQSSTQAAYWYRRAAFRDLPMAQFHLGLLYLPGSGLPPDPIQAYAWLTLAADHEYPEALANRDVADELLDKADRSRAEDMAAQLRKQVRQRQKKK
jgi:TPR repeat protein